MGRIAVVLSLLLIGAAALPAGTDIVILPGNGDEVPIAEAPHEIEILAPGGLVPHEVVVTDVTGAPVPGEIEVRGNGETAFVPEARPFPRGQYTVEIADTGKVGTFTVGPDDFAPRAVSVGPEIVGRADAVTIELTEPLDPTSVLPGTVRVYEVTDGGRRPVPGQAVLVGGGTEIRFTPEGWPGFTPEGTFEVEIDEKVTDLSGNRVAADVLTITGDTEVPVPGRTRVPECVFWSSRREIGILGLAGQRHDKFDSHRSDLGSTLTGDPKELAVSPAVDIEGAGHVFGIDPRQDRLVVLDTGTGTVFHERASHPADLAVSPDGKWVYVAGRASIGRKTGRIEAFSTEGRQIHTADGTYFTPAYREESTSLGEDVHPSSIAVSPDGRTLATLDAKRDSALVFGAAYLNQEGFFPTDPKPLDLTFVSRPGGGSVILVACRGSRKREGSVTVYDVEAGRLLGRLTGFAKPVRVAAKGSRAWVAEQGARRVTAIDVPAEGMPTRGPSYEAGPRPRDVAIAPDGSGRLFVVNKGKGRVTVLSGETGEILGTAKTKGAIAVGAWQER